MPTQLREKSARSDTAQTTYDGRVLVNTGKLFQKPEVRNLIRSIREKTRPVQPKQKPAHS